MQRNKGLLLQNPLIAASVVIFGNLIPLYGVIFWGWELFDIFYIYWAENVLIGFFVAARMLMVAAAWGWVILIGSLFKVAFFTVHYGMFTWGHGMILFEIFYKGQIDINENTEFLLGYMFTRGNEIVLAMLGLLAVTTIKGLHDILEDKREARLPDRIMFSPYGRILVLHVTIIFGGLLAQELGAPIWALGFLIALKTAYDLAVVQGVDFFKITEQKTDEKQGE